MPLTLAECSIGAKEKEFLKLRFLCSEKPKSGGMNSVKVGWEERGNLLVKPFVFRTGKL